LTLEPPKGSVIIAAVESREKLFRSRPRCIHETRYDSRPDAPQNTCLACRCVLDWLRDLGVQCVRGSHSAPGAACFSGDKRALWHFSVQVLVRSKGVQDRFRKVWAGVGSPLYISPRRSLEPRLAELPDSCVTRAGFGRGLRGARRRQGSRNGYWALVHMRNIHSRRAFLGWAESAGNPRRRDLIPKTNDKCPRFTQNMKNYALVAISILLLTGSRELLCASELVFVGYPDTKLLATGTNVFSEVVSVKDSNQYNCRIISEGGRFFWASRENKELFLFVDGAFTSYCTKDSSGIVKILTGQSTLRYSHDYFETVSTGLTTLTYWGHKAPIGNAEDPPSTPGAWIDRIKAADNNRSPEFEKAMDSLKTDANALGRASGEIAEAYSALFDTLTNGAPTTETSTRAQNLKRTSATLAEALEKYRQAFTFSLPKLDLNRQQIAKIRRGFATVQTLSDQGKAVAEAAARYVVSVTEKNRAELVAAGTEFENQWAQMIAKGRQNIENADALLKESKN